MLLFRIPKFLDICIGCYRFGCSIWFVHAHGIVVLCAFAHGVYALLRSLRASRTTAIDPNNTGSLGSVVATMCNTTIYRNDSIYTSTQHIYGIRKHTHTYTHIITFSMTKQLRDARGCLLGNIARFL